MHKWHWDFIVVSQSHPYTAVGNWGAVAEKQTAKFLRSFRGFPVRPRPSWPLCGTVGAGMAGLRARGSDRSTERRSGKAKSRPWVGIWFGISTQDMVRDFYPIIWSVGIGWSFYADIIWYNRDTGTLTGIDWEYNSIYGQRNDLGVFENRGLHQSFWLFWKAQ